MEHDPDKTEWGYDAMEEEDHDDMDDECNEFESDDYDDGQDSDDFDDAQSADRCVQCEKVIPRLLEQLYTVRFSEDEGDDELEFQRLSVILSDQVVDDARYFSYKAYLANGQVRVEARHNIECNESEGLASLLYHVCNLGCDYETIETVHKFLFEHAEQYEVEAAVRGECDSETMDLLLLRSDDCFPKGFFIRDCDPENSCVGFDFEMQDLVTRIRKTTTIQEVCLVHDEIKEGDLKDLIIALSGLHQLTRLTIHGQFQEGCVAVPIPSIGQLINLVHLDLSVRNWGPSIAGPLSELVKTTTALTHVSLRYNNIGQKGMRLICDALRFNKSILDLTLDQKEPLVGMLKVLDHNSTILNVSRFGIQTEQFRSWLVANFVGRRALFDEHCSKETFVDVLCSLKKEALDRWQNRFGSYYPNRWRSRCDDADLQSVLYVLLRTKPDVWSK